MIISAAQRLSHVQEYYFARKLREVRALAAQGHPVINLGIGNPDLPPDPHTVAALTASAAQPAHHGYQPYRGIPELRQAFADWYGQVYRTELDPETEVLPLLGSKEGIFYVSMAFLDPGDRVWVPDPGYPAYATAARLAGAEAVAYDLTADNGWWPDLDVLRQADTTRLKIMWLNYPHMPTGTPADADKLTELVAFARERNILLVHDNPYSLVLNAQPLSLLEVPGARATSIELNSLSKSHNMAGWRVGVAVGRADYLDALVAVKSNVDSGAFLPVQHAAAAALRQPEAFHIERNDHYARRRQFVHQMLDALRCTYDPTTAGMFVWARVPDTVPDVEAYLDEILHRHYVFITPGQVFGRNGTRYLRVSVCAPEAAIAEATRRIVG